MTWSLDGNLDEDTIAAIATGSSDAGIGIVRISGPEAGTVIGRIFRFSSEICRENQAVSSDHECPDRKLNWKPGTIHYGYIVDPGTQEPLDEVLVSWLQAPHSYTCEDTAEINTHGGRYVMQKVLSAVLRAGARPAEPGEFTKRAFLHGRMDLSEAEAVMDLVHSQSEFARRMALSQLSGSVSGSVALLRSEILYEMAYIESALDDPEHYTLDGYPDTMEERCRTWIRQLKQLLDRSERGRLLRDGISAVIAGRPNVGKSSLMNTLTDSDRAIVTEIPGTTRDTLEETVRFGDVLLRLTDTAGIHDTADAVEKIGVERSRRAMDTAQLIFFVIDASQKLSDEDRRIADLVLERMKDGSKCIVLLNKEDLPQQTDPEDIQELFRACLPEDGGIAAFDVPSSGDGFIERSGGVDAYSPDVRQNLPPTISLSINTGKGLDRLESTIRELFLLGDLAESGEVLLSGERQLSEVRKTLFSLQLVQDSISRGVSEEFYMVDLQNAYAALGRILGKEVEDDLVDEIFSRFCMGK